MNKDIDPRSGIDQINVYYPQYTVRRKSMTVAARRDVAHFIVTWSVGCPWVPR